VGVVLTFRNFIRRGDDGIGDVRGEFAQVFVGLGARGLEVAEGVDHRPGKWSLGDREVFHGPRGARAVERIIRHLHLPHRVTFGSHVCPFEAFDAETRRSRDAERSQ